MIYRSLFILNTRVSTFRITHVWHLNQGTSDFEEVEEFEPFEIQFQHYDRVTVPFIMRIEKK